MILGSEMLKCNVLRSLNLITILNTHNQRCLGGKTNSQNFFKLIVGSVVLGDNIRDTPEFMDKKHACERTVQFPRVTSDGKNPD